MPGVGVDTAGQPLVTAGDNAGRLRSERSFARLCGVAPARCIAEGRTRKGIPRCLKRYIAREIFARLLSSRPASVGGHRR